MIFSEIILKSFESYTHIYIGFLLALFIFFSSVFGSKVSDKKEEKLFYGSILVLTVIPIFLYSQLNNGFLVIFSFLLFFITSIHIINFQSLINNIQSKYFVNNVIRKYISSRFTKIALALTFFTWGIISIFINLNNNQQISLSIFIIYFICGIFFIIDFILNFMGKDSFWRGKIYFKDEKVKPIKFDGIQYKKNLNYFAILTKKDEKLIFINNNEILKIEFVED